MFTAITVTRTFLRILIRFGLDQNKWLFAVVDDSHDPVASAAAD